MLKPALDYQELFKKDWTPRETKEEMKFEGNSRVQDSVLLRQGIVGPERWRSQTAPEDLRTLSSTPIVLINILALS
jgi:hypothetical protein